MSLWRDGDFLKLWAGQTVSLFGSRFTGLAVQFVAAVTLQATAAEMGLLAAVNTAPLLLSLFAGVWVDRHRRRTTMIAADVGRALLLATIPGAALLGTLSLLQLYAVGFLTAALGVLFDVAYTSYLPTLVERNRLVEGNSKLSASGAAANVAGFAVGGAVVDAIGAPLAVGLDAVSYVVSVASLLLIRRPEPPTSHGSAPVLAEIREGIGLVLGSPILRAFAGCVATSNLATAIFFGLYVIYGTRELGLDATAVGLVYGIGVVGAVVGAGIAGRVTDRLGIGPTLVATALLGSLEVAPAVVATPATAVPLLLLSSAVGNFGWSLYNVGQVSVRQTIVPAEHQGRLSATMSFLGGGVIPIGGLIGGALGEALGLRGAIAISAVGSALSSLWIALSPVRAIRRMPDVESSGDAGW